MNECIDTTEDWRMGKILEKKLIEENDGLPVNFRVKRKVVKITNDIQNYFSSRSPCLSAKLPSSQEKAKRYQYNIIILTIEDHFHQEK